MAAVAVAAPVRLAWDAQRLRLHPDPHTDAGPGAGDLRIIDSWVVRDGRRRAPERHAARFSAACAELYGVPEAHTAAFLSAAAAETPRHGRWFPRVELVALRGRPLLRFWIRPAPAPGRSVRLWISSGPDRRLEPSVKGPDLGHLSALREHAVAQGGDEALILSAQGHVLEGATTNLMWWRRDGTLVTPPADGGILPGVTRAVLLDAVSASGGRIAFERAEPARLDGLEVWAVNALHAIRPVTGCVAGEFTPGPAHRVRQWNTYLDELFRNEDRDGRTAAGTDTF